MTQPIRLDASWLEPHWMPFTGNREFKSNPRMFVAADGAYYVDSNGTRVFDGLSGLWCCGLGHGRREIVEVVQAQVATLDALIPPAGDHHNEAQMQILDRS